MTSPARTKPRSRLPLLVIATMLLVAAAIRTWHDRHQQAGIDAAEIERHARTMPDNLQAQLDLGNDLAQHQRLQEAVQVFAHAAQIAPRDPRPYIWLGALAVQDHRPDYALANFLRAARLSPSDPQVWHALGDLYAHKHSRHHAIDAYEHAVRLQPADEVAWRQLGVLETEADLRARGYDALMHATTLKPDDMDARIDLGNCALITGHLPQAKQAFDYVLAAKPNDPAALLGDAEAGMQLDPSSEGLARAERQAARALTLTPTPHTHLVLGRIALARKDYARAASELNVALAVKSSDLSAYGYLSQAYAGMGRPDLARKASADYQQADARARAQSQPSGSLEPKE